MDKDKFASQVIWKFGERIKFYKNKLGLTQEQLAERINLQPSTLSYIENGKNNISYMKLAPLCEALQIEPYKLFVFDYRERDNSDRVKDINNLLNSMDKNQLELSYRILYDLSSYSNI